MEISLSQIGGASAPRNQIPSTFHKLSGLARGGEPIRNRTKTGTKSNIGVVPFLFRPDPYSLFPKDSGHFRSCPLRGPMESVRGRKGLSFLFPLISLFSHSIISQIFHRLRTYVSRFSRDGYQINNSGALILYTTTNVFASSCKSIPEVSVMLAIMDDLPQSSYGT